MVPNDKDLCVERLESDPPPHLPPPTMGNIIYPTAFKNQESPGNKSHLSNEQEEAASPRSGGSGMFLGVHLWELRVGSSSKIPASREKERKC